MPASASGGLGQSRSSPAMKMSSTFSGGFGKTLKHRGEHDVGMVLGHNDQDDLYVPRAMWTATFDSPLKQSHAKFDAQTFMEDENKRQQHKEGMKAYMQNQLGRQMQETFAFRGTMRDEKNELNRAVTADVQRQQQRQRFEHEEEMKNRAHLRATLDRQVSDLDRRAKEGRMQALTEGAELKARCMQQLCQELQTQANRKKAMKKDADDMRAEQAKRASDSRAARQREADDLNETIRTQTMQDEYRLAAQQERLRAAQANADAKEANFMATAGAESNAKTMYEIKRLDRDEKQHQMRSDLHYSRREAARERQRQNMVNTLNMQLGASGGKKELERLGKEKDRDAVNTSHRLAIEADLARHRQKKQEEVELQAELVRQMKDKQAREREELDGFKPNAATNTMEVNQSFLDMSLARAKSAGSLPKSNDLMHRVDAAKHLDKPCGRAEVKPWVDIASSLGIGGVSGVFGGEGHMKMKMASTGGMKRIMTKSSALAMRDHQMQATWSEGLSGSELKSGLKNAKKRHQAQLVDKSDRF